MKLRRSLALAAATFALASITFAPTVLAVEPEGVEVVALADAGPYPSHGTCTSAAKSRHKTESPACTVIVECPADSSGCAFVGRIIIESKRTVGTAQGRMRIEDQATGQYVDFFCSSPAAISAKDQGCTTAATTFVPAGTVFEVTCSWIGATVSTNPRVTCEAAMDPLGEF